MVQDMRVAREEARRAARDHASALAAIEARVRERDQQLAALRAEQAALMESVTLQLQAYEQRDEARQVHQGRVSGQLAATETWCADQQDLLYRIRQQMSAMFALLDGSGAADSGPGLAALDAAVVRSAGPVRGELPAGPRPAGPADPGSSVRPFRARGELTG